MSSIRIKNLPASTGVLNTDNLIVSSDDLTYKLPVSGIKKQLIKQTTNLRAVATELNYDTTANDINNIINVNKSVPSTVTITSAASTSANIGDHIDVFNTSSTSDVRILSPSGVYIRSMGNHVDLTRQYGVGKITKFSSNEWMLTGDFFTSPSGTF
tara:strand:- start:43121 stop:43588 length:468 start_codon:yes stop_codon:yes gene_type:complete